MSRSREREIDMVRAAIRAEAPYDYRRETRWQYDNRLAAAARDALAKRTGRTGEEQWLNVSMRSA